MPAVMPGKEGGECCVGFMTAPLQNPALPCLPTAPSFHLLHFSYSFIQSPTPGAPGLLSTNRPLQEPALQRLLLVR